LAKHQCGICGYTYDEEKADESFQSLDKSFVCPVCGSGKNSFYKLNESIWEKSRAAADAVLGDRQATEADEYMYMIHKMAQSGKTIRETMRPAASSVSWKDILIMGAQFNPMPLHENDFVNTRTVIGKRAAQPMVLESPIIVSHMSYGSVSKEIKTALAKGSAAARTAIGSGEGGILQDERDAAYKYIFEIVPDFYSVTVENLRNADAIEIKIGNGAHPGMGGFLPGYKVTEEIAELRNKPVGEDIYVPSRFVNIRTKEDLKAFIDDLRIQSGGRPVGVKMAAGNIEHDMVFIKYAKPDFITIDGRGGSVGASPGFVKDATSVPTIFALYRTRKYLIEHNLNIDLIITGGLRVSSDFAKALAMGATAVAIGTSSLIAAGCQQTHICDSDKCPSGCTTQNPEVRSMIDIDESGRRVANFLNASLEELKVFARITGNNDIHELSIENLRTVNSEISKYTNIKHV